MSQEAPARPLAAPRAIVVEDEQERPKNLFDHALEILAAVLLATIVLLLFLNAFIRFTGGAAWPWSSEIVTGLMLWLTMIGFTIGVRREDSIRVRALIRLAPERIQIMAKVVTDVVAVVVLFHLAWYGYQFVAAFGNDATPYLRLPQSFFTAALPVGAFLSGVLLLLQLRRSREMIRQWADEESAE